MTVVSSLLVVLNRKDVYRCLFLVCFICIGVRMVSNVCSGFCCSTWTCTLARSL